MKQQRRPAAKTGTVRRPRDGAPVRAGARAGERGPQREGSWAKPRPTGAARTRPAGAGKRPGAGARPAAGPRTDRPPRGDRERFDRGHHAPAPAPDEDHEILEPGPASDPYVPTRRPLSRGFTVTLDPDVARVFRGDASVNKALRLVLQLMQVVQGPGAAVGAPPRSRPAPAAPRRGYQGSAEARGFERQPRFEEDDEGA